MLFYGIHGSETGIKWDPRIDTFGDAVADPLFNAVLGKGIPLAIDYERQMIGFVVMADGPDFPTACDMADIGVPGSWLHFSAERAAARWARFGAIVPNLPPPRLMILNTTLENLVRVSE